MAMAAGTRLLFVLAGVLGGSGVARAAFETQEIGRDLDVVYAVDIADVNADGRPDIVAVNNTQAMWFAAPGWTKHVIFDGTKLGHPFWKKDNVCFAMEDIDGDGRLDMALGAHWIPPNTETGGSVQWLRQDAKDATAPWQFFPIHAPEPALHRMRWADVDGDGRRELIVKALQGRGTRPPDWTGTGLRLLAFRRPADPTKTPWPSEVIDESLHTGHNFLVLGAPKGRGRARQADQLIVASAEGLSHFARSRAGTMTRLLIGEGRPGEVKLGWIGRRRQLATVEPWHGNALVIHRDPGGPIGKKLWPREVIETGMNEGHALGWADFDGDGDDELVAGWRKAPFALAHYRRQRDGKWTRSLIDEGAMAAEDLAVGDLDGDKRPDIVAGGRATKNLRIYWNRR